MTEIPSGLKEGDVGVRALDGMSVRVEDGDWTTVMGAELETRYLGLNAAASSPQAGSGSRAHAPRLHDPSKVV